MAGEASTGELSSAGEDSGVKITVVDADDLLDNPSGMIEAFCVATGIEYEPEMLKWDTEEDQRYAKCAFEKWRGFHEDAIHSTELKAREHVSIFLSLFLISPRKISRGVVG